MIRNTPQTWFIFTAVFVSLALIFVACTESGDDADDPSNDPANNDDANTEEAAESAETWPAEREIVFADYGWDSAITLNRIAQYILEEGYGYETGTVPGETIPLFQGMLSGEIDVSMEIWVDQNPEFAPAVESGEVLDLGISVDNTVQGWWVPTYVIEGDEERGIEPMAPGLSHVDDLPDYWEVFQDPEDPEKGRLYDCIAGWECERYNQVKFDYYGLDEHFNRFLPGSGTALDTSLLTAHDRGEAWLGYYWTPTWVAGMVDLTLLEEPEYTDECWDGIEQALEADEPIDEACAWPVTEAVISVTSDFADEAPDVIAFLEQFTTDESHISDALAYMGENDADPDDAALWFLEEYDDLWSPWVPDDVAERVRDSLNTQ